MIESIWSKSSGEFIVGNDSLLLSSFGKVNQITEISKNNSSFFRVMFDTKVIDVYDVVLVIRNNE